MRQYFANDSRRFGHGRLALPSQRCDFRLVRQAMGRGEVVVPLRGKSVWFEVVLEPAACASSTR